MFRQYLHRSLIVKRHKSRFLSGVPISNVLVGLTKMRKHHSGFTSRQHRNSQFGTCCSVLAQMSPFGRRRAKGGALLLREKREYPHCPDKKCLLAVRFDSLLPRLVAVQK